MLSGIKVVDGRLYFPNIETFQAYYEDVKEKDETMIANILASRFYKKDFSSLIPIFNEDTEELYAEKQLLAIKEQYRSVHKNVNTPTDEDIFEHFDDLEEIIGEDVFGSFLNSEAEIQVGNKIYKYTDRGVLIVQVENTI